MFEKFSDQGRRVIVLSQEEARLLNHNYIGTEHILLGLVHEGEGVAAKALESLNVRLDAVRREVEELVDRGGSPPSEHIPFTPRAKKVLELSLREAIQLGHNYIGTEHILLGLLREGEGVACQVLVRLGASLPVVRARVVQLVTESSGERASGWVFRPSAELTAVLDEAHRVAEAKGEAQVMPIHLFLAAIEHPDGAAGRMLETVGVDPHELRRQLTDESDDAPDDESG
jgi:ATP-dependent Clp protease ATP-binding subunit ClpC